MIATSNGRTRIAAALVALLTFAGCQALPDAHRKPSDEVPGPPAGEPPGPDGGALQDERPDRRSEAPATATTDLWQAIRSGFALDHEIDHPRVRAELDALLRYPDHLYRLRDRLELFLPHVHRAVAERGFPGEIALLPIIESGMNPHAEAIGGPVGLWQFIPATADRLGLPRNPWYDGRRDPVLSTRAALDYLDYLHGRFQDWRLAIVAYNAGEGTVTRAMQGKAEPVSFWSLRLPAAGMVFVPKLLALAEVVAHPERYGITLPPLQSDGPFTTLPTGGQVNIAGAAEALGIDEETLYLLNPALNRSATPPDGPHQLNVPRALEQPARNWLATLDHDERAQWERIQVRRGDSLGLIARRHGTDVRTLKQINGLPDDRLRAGQYLNVPADDRAPRPSQQGTTRPDPNAAGRTHVVQSGDTLWAIARTYRVAVDRLRTANRLDRDQVLRIGQRLRIPDR